MRIDRMKKKKELTHTRPHAKLELKRDRARKRWQRRQRWRSTMATEKKMKPFGWRWMTNYFTGAQRQGNEIHLYISSTFSCANKFQISEMEKHIFFYCSHHHLLPFRLLLIFLFIAFFSISFFLLFLVAYPLHVADASMLLSVVDFELIISKYFRLGILQKMPRHRQIALADWHRWSRIMTTVCCWISNDFVTLSSVEKKIIFLWNLPNAMCSVSGVVVKVRKWNISHLRPLETLIFVETRRLRAHFVPSPIDKSRCRYCLKWRDIEIEGFRAHFEAFYLRLNSGTSDERCVSTI